MWEVEFGRMCPGQSQQEKFVIVYLSGRKLGVVAGACHSSNGRKPKIGGLCFILAWGKSEILSPK
jgi:hypothetical protein